MWTNCDVIKQISATITSDLKVWFMLNIQRNQVTCSEGIRSNFPGNRTSRMTKFACNLTWRKINISGIISTYVRLLSLNYNWICIGKEIQVASNFSRYKSFYLYVQVMLTRCLEPSPCFIVFPWSHFDSNTVCSFQIVPIFTT